MTCAIAFDIRGRDVSLDVQAATEISGETFQFNFREVQRRAAQVNGFIMASESPQGKKSRNPPTPQMIQAAKTASADFKALETLMGELRREVSIPFCIYVVAGAADDNTAPKVIIFQRAPDDAANAAGPKKNKGKARQGPRSAESSGSERQVRVSSANRRRRTPACLPRG